MKEEYNIGGETCLDGYFERGPLRGHLFFIAARDAAFFTNIIKPPWNFSHLSFANKPSYIYTCTHPHDTPRVVSCAPWKLHVTHLIRLMYSRSSVPNKDEDPLIYFLIYIFTPQTWTCIFTEISVGRLKNQLNHCSSLRLFFLVFNKAIDSDLMRKNNNKERLW